MTYTPLANITAEHLGPEATDEDVIRYREAVERVMGSAKYDRDEEAASEYVWNKGDILFDAGACLYCEGVTPDITDVPAVDDDEGWELLAPDHLDDCEWITTRAHRINA